MYYIYIYICCLSALYMHYACPALREGSEAFGGRDRPPRLSELPLPSSPVIMMKMINHYYHCY